ncbi:FAD:protein FMN transferase [Gammaproteobacteria bacterium]
MNDRSNQNCLGTRHLNRANELVIPPTSGLYSLRRANFVFLRVWVLFLVAGCSPAPEPLFEQTFYIFGTMVNLTLWGVSKERAQEAAAAVEADLQTMHHDWHAWQPSEVTRLNQAITRGEPFRASPRLLTLIRTSQEAERRSEGMFNPAVGHLIGLWGFHQDLPPTGPPPTRAEVALLVAQHPSTLDLTIEGDVVRSRNPAVELDFGGIAKGYAGDLVINKLGEMGINNAIFNAGGGLEVIGRRGDRPWRIGIRHPQGNGILASVELGPTSEGMHTSGNYERFREYSGKRYQHIIDPRTGMPVDGIVSATVIHPDGIWSDASTKGMVVGGERCWSHIAGKMGLTSVLLVDDKGTVYMTPEMQRRVHFEREPARVVVKDTGIPGSGGEAERECRMSNAGGE